MTVKPHHAVAVACCLVLPLASCSMVNGKSAGGPTKPDGFVFATAGAPRMFDPFLSSEGEAFRITRQMFEGLVTFTPGTLKAGQGLATSWTHTPDRKHWTFTLREGVKFHDGTPFNGDAVCKNFDRMYDLPGRGSAEGSYYWSLFMGAFKGQGTSLFQQCKVLSPTSVEIVLTRASSRFPDMLGLPPFAMQSPTAMQKYNADKITESADKTGFKYPEYATAHPTGTGPFMFDSHEPSSGRIVLKRNDQYWNGAAKLDKVTFTSVPDENIRRQDLMNGTIQGYDLPNPADWKALTAAGKSLLVRPARNLLYLGLNAKVNPKLADLRVRQAIMYAINRSQIVKTQLADKAVVATQFAPADVKGYNDTLKSEPWNPQKARKLLAEAGAEGMTLELWYPTEVSRPYMPQPARIFEAIRADLEIAGIVVKPVSKPWNGGYLDGVDGGQAASYILGTTHELNSFDGYYGLLFGTTQGELSLGKYSWGAGLVNSVVKNDAMTDEAARDQANYKLASEVMNNFLPAIPIAHSPSALVVDKSVSGLQASPMTDESFKDVSLN